MDFITYRKEIEKNIKELYENINNQLKKYLENQDITPFQFTILATIVDKKKCTIGNLSTILKLDSGNMSAMCKKLEQKGWLKRERSKEDERIVEVCVTETTIHKIKEIEAKINKKYKEFITNISPIQLETIIQGLKNMNQYLEAQNKKEGETA